jgi:hypothetical protein
MKLLIGNSLTDTLTEAVKPEKIKIEWRYLPDWFLDFSTPKKPSKFVELTRPKVYIKTKSGYTIGYDVYSGQRIPVPENAFTPGKFQSFLSSPDFKTLLLFSALGIVLKLLDQSDKYKK